MTNYFLDSTTGSDLDNGTTMDLAWATIDYAETQILAGDIVWIRRLHSEVGNNFGVNSNATPKNPKYYIGWPRNTHSISSSDWTNGSSAVVVDDADMDREKHCGRYITGPDTYIYLITRVVDASNIVIDREYAGTTVSNQGATISADEDYTTAQAINDSGWTITKTDYNGDADDLPCLDFNSGVFNVYFNGKVWHTIKNIELKNAATTMFYLNTANGIVLKGSLLSTTSNSILVYCYARSNLYMERCIISGSGAGASQRGLQCYYGNAVLKDVAIYGCGDWGLYAELGRVVLEDVNIGVEIANGDDDIYLAHHGNVYGRDIKLGGTNGLITFNDTDGFWAAAAFENYGKTLGVHKAWTPQGTIAKVSADGTGDYPNKRSGGSSNVIELLYDSSLLSEPEQDITIPKIFNHEFETDTSSKSYRYYVQSMAALTASQLWIEAEYVNSYDDTSEYTITEVESDEAITARDDNNDWDQYIEVTGIQPAIASKVRIRCFCNYKHATNKVYIDPKVVIS